MRVYISGPMTGLPGNNYPLFHEAEEVVRGLGHEPLNPARNFNGCQGCEIHQRPQFMRLDYENVMRAEIVFFLPGWRQSAGALREFLVAEDLGLVRLEFDECWQLHVIRDKVEAVLVPVTVFDEEGDDAPETYSVPEPEKESVLQEAQRLIHGDRNDSYGHPLDDFGKTGRMWGAILGIPDVSPEKVGLCMTAVKISRAVNDLDLDRPIKRDNLVDLGGYTGTVEMVQDERQRRAP